MNVLPFFRTQFNYSPVLRPSLDRQNVTVPDLALSPAEILSRYSRGLPVTGNGAVDIPYDVTGINDLDKFAKIDMKRRLDKRKTVLESERLAKVATDKLAADELRIEQEIAKRTTPKNTNVSEAGNDRGANEA